MPPTLQPKSQVPTASLSRDRDHIEISEGYLSREEALDFANQVKHLATICNVAIFQPSHIFSLWDSIKAPEAFTVEVNAATLADLQRLSKIGDNIEKSVIELINFYEDKPILNIILLPDAISSRESYIHYTAQFAHTLTTNQSHHPHIKVLYDKNTSRLGIFCRKNKFTSNAFNRQLALSLHKHRNVFIPQEQIPKTYRTNFAMLKQHLKSDFPDLKIVRTPDGIVLDNSAN